MECRMGRSAIMARQQAQATSHLAVAPNSTKLPLPRADAATRLSGLNEPVLAALLICCYDGHAVDEVLRWDGRQLSLRLTPNSKTTPGPSEVIVQVSLASYPGIAST